MTVEFVKDKIFMAALIVLEKAMVACSTVMPKLLIGVILVILFKYKFKVEGSYAN